MSFEEENSTTCPRCAAVVPPGNAYCGTCGAPVPRETIFSREHGIEPTSSVSTRQQRPLPPPYDRKLSIFGRITGLLTSPKEAMEDIGRAPDYNGVIVLFAIWTIISFIGLALTLPKLQFTGPYADMVNSGILSGVVLAGLLVPVGLVIRWLVKSYLIRHMTDSNAWNFEAAASVTGYAYLPNLIFSFIGIFLSWMFVPSVIIDTADLTQATLDLQAYAASIFWITFGINTVLSLAALIWKSYLGSHGTYYGTHKRIETGSAFGTFMIIGFIGFVIDFVSSFL